MKLALFLGAGFSKWAVDLPVASELFDFRIQPWGQREYRKFHTVRSLKQSWDEAHPGSLAEQFIADGLRFPMKEREAVLWYLARRLSEPFLWYETHSGRQRRHVLMIDEYRKFRNPGTVDARRFLLRFYGPFLTGLITTNYDLVIEYGLGTAGFNYGVVGQPLVGRGPYPLSQWRKPVRLEGKVPLAKIHGSISWDEKACYTDGRRALTGHALIVAPVPEKSRPDSLRTVWSLAKQILEHAKRLIVFGFAFNDYDNAVLELLESAGRKLESVLLINVSAHGERAQRLWPSARITCCQPPPKGEGAIKSWMAI